MCNTTDERRLTQRTNRWINDLKLTSLKGLTKRLHLCDIYRRWRDWKLGITHDVEKGHLEPGVHGRTRIRGGEVDSITISQRDPPGRQLLALVHELLHAQYYPELPEHGQLHTLAAGLARVIFPQYHGRSTSTMEMVYDDEAEAFTALAELAEGPELDLNYEYGEYSDHESELEVAAEAIASLPDEEQEVILNDLESDGVNFDLDWSWKKLRRKITKAIPRPIRKVIRKVAALSPHGLIRRVLQKRKQKRHSTQRRKAGLIQAGFGKAAPQLKADQGAGLQMSAAYGGHAVDWLTKAFLTNTLTWALRGVTAMTRTGVGANFGLWIPQNDGAWFQTLMQALNAGTGRMQKSIVQATAVAAVPTTVVIPAATRLTAVKIRLSDSSLNGDNRRVIVEHDTAGTQYDVAVNIQPDRGVMVAEYVALLIEQGPGGLIPTASGGATFTVAADGMRPGMILEAESINLRDIQKHS